MRKAHLPAFLAFTVVVASFTGCAERAALEAERDALTAELERRTVVLNEVHAEHRSLKSHLDEALVAAATAVPPFDWGQVSQGLASFSATGRFEATDAEAKLSLSGPGDARYAAQAIAFVARLAPGLVFSAVTLSPTGFTAEGSILRAPSLDYGPVASVDVPQASSSWPWNSGLAAENVALRERIRAADETIGANPVALEQKKLALARFVDGYESPGRAPTVSAWVDKLVAHMKGVKLSYVGRGVVMETEPIDPRIGMDVMAGLLENGLVTTSLSIDEGKMKGEFTKPESE